MRIGLITGEYPPMQGGVGAFTRELALALVQQGHAVHVLTDYHVPSEDKDGIHVSGIVQRWNQACWFAARQWANAHRLDVVNIQYEAAAFHMAQMVHFLPRLMGSIPVVTTFHDLLVPYLFPKAGALRFRALLTLANASRGVIVTNVQDERRLAVEQGHVHLRTIPIGSNITAELPADFDRDEWRNRHGVSPDTILVGYFGFMNASKGVDILLDALAKLSDLKVCLLLIGGRTGSSDTTNADYARQIDEQIARLGLESRLQWTGFVEGPQVGECLNACDIVALPYRDGLSLRRGSFMAAIAHGCAIVTTHPQVELPDVQDRVQALLIPAPPADSAAALAAAIRELAVDPALRLRLGSNARQLATRFTWERIAAQTADFFVEILGAQPT